MNSLHSKFEEISSLFSILFQILKTGSDGGYDSHPSDRKNGW